MSHNTTDDDASEGPNSNYSVWRDFGEIHVGPRPAAYGHPATESFAVATDDATDVVRGDVPETDKTPVMLTQPGGRLSAGDVGDLNDSHRQALEAKGCVLLAGVETGWATWDGRPEWSERYVDYSDAEIVTEIEGDA